MGFHVKDRLGQPLFGDNTFLTYESCPIHAKAGDKLEARFVFSLPLLLTGEYSVCAAIASGTMVSHVQHHWVHDALLFSVHSSSLNGVLVGIPVDVITLSRTAASVSFVGE
jgi:lipopolysaccharide transport system ATP-binding protein